MLSTEEKAASDPVWYIPPWIYSISIILIVVAVICCIGSWVFVFYFRKKPLVAMGQPEFLYNLCFGALLLQLSQVFLIIVTHADHDKNGKMLDLTNSKISTFLNVCCNFATWFIYMGFFVVYTALLCKMYRIMKITHQPLRRGLKILPRHVLWPFFLLVFLLTCLLATWSATGVSKYVIIENPDTNESSGYCAMTWWISDESPSKQCLFAMGVLLVIVQLILLILAYKIRKINQELGDSKRILMLVLFHVIVLVVFTTIVYRVGDKGMLVTTIEFFLFSLSTIGFIIFPRMYYVWYNNRYGHLPENVVMIGTGTTTVQGVN
mmetsp:Transcript_50573/g.56443  ORF Transcript_50573/g.56443 Transcript_50573/m.56443 type:complete len:321 (-) Transcript_50573:280-1242(-)